jgi:hypothetical protein
MRKFEQLDRLLAAQGQQSSSQQPRVENGLPGMRAAAANASALEQQLAQQQQQHEPSGPARESVSGKENGPLPGHGTTHTTGGSMRSGNPTRPLQAEASALCNQVEGEESDVATGIAAAAPELHQRNSHRHRRQNPPPVGDGSPAARCGDGHGTAPNHVAGLLAVQALPYPCPEQAAWPGTQEIEQPSCAVHAASAARCDSCSGSGSGIGEGADDIVSRHRCVGADTAAAAGCTGVGDPARIRAPARLPPGREQVGMLVTAAQEGSSACQAAVGCAPQVPGPGPGPIAEVGGSGGSCSVLAQLQELHRAAAAVAGNSGDAGRTGDRSGNGGEASGSGRGGDKCGQDGADGSGLAGAFCPDQYQALLPAEYYTMLGVGASGLGGDDYWGAEGDGLYDGSGSGAGGGGNGGCSDSDSDSDYCVRKRKRVHVKRPSAASHKKASVPSNGPQPKISAGGQQGAMEAVSGVAGQISGGLCEGMNGWVGGGPITAGASVAVAAARLASQPTAQSQPRKKKQKKRKGGGGERGGAGELLRRESVWKLLGVTAATAAARVPRRQALLQYNHDSQVVYGHRTLGP